LELFMIDVKKDLFDLNGKVAIVTGSAAGLGEAMAVGLAAYGANIIVADIDADGSEATVANIRLQGVEGLSVQCDTSNQDDVHRLFQIVDEKFGVVDILINNVGVAARFKPEELPLDEWKRVLDTNMTSTYLCAREAGKRMIERGLGGSIVNVSSTASSTGMGRGNFVYSSTKGAINQMTRELAVEWAHHGIRVNAIMPAQVHTAYLQRLIDNPEFDSETLLTRVKAGIPMGRLGKPCDLIGPVVFLVSDASAFVTGALIPIDGGNLAFNACGSLEW
jgi:NAD(P)-dependent dehydrogenase (short-subunit alcohol dehydrogenase family)